MAEQRNDDHRAGLCAECAHGRRVPHPRGDPGYWRCARAGADPAYPRYPALPVTACRGFEAAARESENA